MASGKLWSDLWGFQGEEKKKTTICSTCSGKSCVICRREESQGMSHTTVSDLKISILISAAGWKRQINACYKCVL